jgi:transcriptional regulator with XRE-family HTH domain
MDKYPNMQQTFAIIESEIGKRIKALRLEKKITLEKLSVQTGFTKGYLSKVEKSEKAPPVSTLGTIARALNVTISYLLGENDYSVSISLVKKRERQLIIGEGTAVGYSYEAVAHNFKNKMMEPFVLTLPVNPRKRKVYQHEGQEILFILEGTMRFFHGTAELLVEEGDCVYFDSSIPHFGESVGDKAAKCFMVVFSPSNK